MAVWRILRTGPLRVVLVGAGEWGATWATEIRSAPGYELAAIVELDVELGRPRSRRRGLTTQQSL